MKIEEINKKISLSQNELKTSKVITDSGCDQKAFENETGVQFQLRKTIRYLNDEISQYNEEINSLLLRKTCIIEKEVIFKSIATCIFIISTNDTFAILFL